jgi:hypothetical protein
MKSLIEKSKNQKLITDYLIRASVWGWLACHRTKNEEKMKKKMKKK